MNRTLVASIAAAVVLLAGLTVLTRWMLKADRRLESLDADVTQLSERLDLAETRAGEAETRVAEAERQASVAQQEAATAQTEAAAARGEAAAAGQQALRAEAESEAAEKARLASIEGQREAEREREQALTREASALAEATAAYEAATAAQQDAAQARAEATELRRQRERELTRLENALGELADTRRTALGLVMNLGNSVEFDTDRVELRPQNRELLARIAGVLLTAGDYNIQVFGHTDDVGDERYNQELSERRAQSVVDYLVESGVRANVISAQGLGKSQPLVEGIGREARQRNRRVEIAVISYNEEFVAQEPP